jgi:hypothetical protein
MVIAGIFITQPSLRLEQNDDDYDSPPISLTKMPADKDEEEYRTTEFCRGYYMLRPGFEPGIVALRGRNA